MPKFETWESLTLRITLHVNMSTLALWEQLAGTLKWSGKFRKPDETICQMQIQRSEKS